MAACTFIDAKFDFRAPKDRVLLRCFFGGAGDDKVLEESDETLGGMAREELLHHSGIRLPHRCSLPFRDALAPMAQYTVGHSAR